MYCQQTFHRNLRLVLTVALFIGPASFGWTADPPRAPGDKGKALSSPGRATRDPEKWTTAVRQSRQLIAGIQKPIFEQVPQAMANANTKLNEALESFRARPTPETRRALQQVTVNELQQLRDLLKPISDQRETIMLTITRLQGNVQDRVDNLETEVKKLDESLPLRKIDLDKRRKENDQRKATLPKPTDPKTIAEQRLAKAELRKAWEAETQLETDIRHDERLRQLRAQTAKSMTTRAAEVEAIQDALLETFLNLSKTQKELESTSAVLAEAIQGDLDLSELGGGQGVDGAFAAAESAGAATGQLLDQLKQVMDAASLSDNPTTERREPLPPTNFQRWLEARVKETPPTK